MSNRRDFIFSTGALGAMALSSSAIKFAASQQSDELVGEVTMHKLPELDYPYDALEPYIDGQTMKLHHSKHHQAYIDGLNKAEAELAKARARGDFSMIDYWTKKTSFHSAGHYFHTLFWKMMTPKGGGEAKNKLAEKIKQDFGSFELFKKQFSAASVQVEGSGWGVFAYRRSDKRLVILQAENHQKLTPLNVEPLLLIDVWEHAYYLKYQNRRSDYINAWWNVVNWDYVEELFGENIK